MNPSPPWFIRPGVVAAAAITCSYWVSQILATDVVSDALNCNLPKILGALCFSLFAILFLMHLIKPLSKTAAMLGLGSLCVFTAAMAYQVTPGTPYLPFVRHAFSVSTVLGVAGVALDATKCWRMLRTHIQEHNSPVNFDI